MRVSKADGSQTLDLQRDALLVADVGPDRLSEDLASGRRDDRPGLTACLKALRNGDILVVLGPAANPATPVRGRERARRSGCPFAVLSRIEPELLAPEASA